MYWDNGHMDNGWGVFMMLGMFCFAVLITLAFVWFVHTTRVHDVLHAHSQSNGDGRSSNADEILAQRLARGEIDPDEYQARKRALNQTN